MFSIGVERVRLKKLFLRRVLFGDNLSTPLYRIIEIKRIQNLSSRSGYTLIETLMAILLLSISIVLILELFSGGLKSAKFSNDYLRGVFHAREKMEEMLARDDLSVISNQNGQFADGYEWQVYITEEDLSGENILNPSFPIALFRVDVNVSWKIGEKEKQFEISTLQILKKKV